MKKGEKIFLLVLIAVTAIVIIFAIVSKRKNSANGTMPNTNVAEQNVVKEEFVKNLEDGTKLNTSTALTSEKKFGDLVFQNIQLTNNNGQTILLADVTNTGSQATPLQLVDVVILDKNGQEIGKVGGIVGQLEPGSKTQFNSGTQRDYSNAYDFKIQAKEQ